MQCMYGALVHVRTSHARMHVCSQVHAPMSQVDGKRYYDGGMAELVPDVGPGELGLAAGATHGSAGDAGVLSIDICSWGNLGEG